MRLFKSLAEASRVPLEVTALKLNLKETVFPESLFEFPNLSELYLEGNCKNFPELKGAWRKLSTLSIKCPGISADLSALFTLPSIINLKILDTPMERFYLPLGVASWSLTSLTVKDCGLLNLPEEISMVTGLKEMNLSGNKLSKLPYSFPELRNLKRLNLDGNEFSKFPDMVKSMPKLSHLSIDGNPFPEEERDRIQRTFHLWL